MAKRTIIFLFSLTAVGAALLLLAVNLSNSQASRDGLADNPYALQEQVQAMEELVVDPNAYNQNYEKPYPELLKAIKYQSKTSGPDLVTFYENQMASRGWTLEGVNNNIDYHTYIRFTWLEPSESLPYDLISDVSVFDDRPPSHPMYADHDSAYIGVEIRRIPKVSQVPLYPGAMQMQTQDIEVPTGVEDNTITQHNITFLTSATPMEVKVFYTATLTSYGWSPLDAALEPLMDEPIPNSFAFNWRTGGPEQGVKGASVGVILETTKEGTRVELRIRGHTYFDR